MRQRWSDRSSGARHKAAWHPRSSPCVAPPGRLATAVAVSAVPQGGSFSSENLQPSLALPIVSVLDIETGCSVKLHIDDWTGELDFVDRARPLEQGAISLIAGCIDDGLTGRRRQRYDHGHHGCRFRNVFRHIDFDRRRLDLRVAW